MRKMRWKRLAAFALAVLLFAGAVPAAAPVQAYASEVSVYSDKIQRGKTGKSLTVSFTIKNTSGSEIKDAKIAFDTSGGEIWDEDEEDRSSKGNRKHFRRKREEGISDRYGTAGSVRGLL